MKFCGNSQIHLLAGGEGGGEDVSRLTQEFEELVTFMRQDDHKVSFFHDIF